MRNKTLVAARWFLTVAMLVAVIGCSSDNPTMPLGTTTETPLLSSTLDAQPPCDKDGFSSGYLNADDQQPYLNHHRNAVDTFFTFTDLQPGYVLEIKANIVDETTMLAVYIKVLGCNFRQSVQFEDY